MRTTVADSADVPGKVVPVSESRRALCRHCRQSLVWVRDLLPATDNHPLEATPARVVAGVAGYVVVRRPGGRLVWQASAYGVNEEHLPVHRCPAMWRSSSSGVDRLRVNVDDAWQAVGG